MVKKLVFVCLIYTFFLNFVTAYAISEFIPPTNSTARALGCDAPPPDSFRIVSIGYNFVTVAWNPASLGDNHLLTVFGENAPNSWDSLYSVNLFNATSYTINNFDQQIKHKLEIRTVCSNGEQGTIAPSLTPPFGLILELTLPGRTPIDPQKAGVCTNLNYNDPVNKWIGFQLSKIVGNKLLATRLFEFEKVEIDNIVGRIKGVGELNNLVVANEDGLWPLFGFSQKTLNLQFRVGEIDDLGQFQGVGYVNVVLNKSSVDLCQVLSDPLKPWNHNFIFTPLVASKVKENCPTCLEGSNAKVRAKNEFKIENPFSEYLNIFFTGSEFKSGLKNILLLDINGKVVFRELIDVACPQISIPIGSSRPGFYTVRIESNEYTQSQKIIKN